MQPKTPLALVVARAHCWLMFNSVSIRTSTSLSAGQLPSWVAPSMSLCWQLFLTISSPPLLPVNSPLDSSTALWWLSHFPQFCIICKFPEGALYLTAQINTDVKQDWTQYWPLGVVFTADLKNTSFVEALFKWLILLEEYILPNQNENIYRPTKFLPSLTFLFHC